MICVPKFGERETKNEWPIPLRKTSFVNRQPDPVFQVSKTPVLPQTFAKPTPSPNIYTFFSFRCGVQGNWSWIEKFMRKRAINSPWGFPFICWIKFIRSLKTEADVQKKNAHFYDPSWLCGIGLSTLFRNCAGSTKRRWAKRPLVSRP